MATYVKTGDIHRPAKFTRMNHKYGSPERGTDIIHLDPVNAMPVDPWGEDNPYASKQTPEVVTVTWSRSITDESSI